MPGWPAVGMAVTTGVTLPVWSRSFIGFQFVGWRFPSVFLLVQLISGDEGRLFYYQEQAVQINLQRCFYCHMLGGDQGSFLLHCVSSTMYVRSRFKGSQGTSRNRNRGGTSIFHCAVYLRNVIRHLRFHHGTLYTFNTRRSNRQGHGFYRSLSVYRGHGSTFIFPRDITNRRRVNVIIPYRSRIVKVVYSTQYGNSTFRTRISWGTGTRVTKIVVPLGGNRFCSIIFQIRAKDFTQVPLRQSSFFLHGRLTPIRTSSALLLPTFPGFRILRYSLVRVGKVRGIKGSRAISIGQYKFRHFSILNRRHTVLMGLFSHGKFRVEGRSRVYPVSQYCNATLLRPGVLYQSRHYRFSNRYQIYTRPSHFASIKVSIATIRRIAKILVVHRRRATTTVKLPRRQRRNLRVFNDHSFPSRSMLSTPRFFRNFLSIKTLIVKLGTYHGVDVRILDTRGQHVTVRSLSHFNTITSLLRSLQIATRHSVNIRRFHGPRRTKVTMMGPRLFYIRRHAKFVRVHNQGAKKRRRVGQGNRVFYHFPRGVRTFRPHGIQSLI